MATSSKRASRRAVSSSASPPGTDAVAPYRMHVSQKYLDLTRQKLELTRLPRDPHSLRGQWDFGVTKADFEPLVDHWLEDYDWRAQETFYNDSLPQFRVAINGTRLHFVHKRSDSPNAMPLLFLHGWPESFITVSKVIDSLCSPVATPPRGDENVQAFHVVAPSIPGFGFSDALPEEGNNIQATASIFNTLMKGLGYNQYMLHGSGWAFKISRAMALSQPDSCIAIHTSNPEVPPPSPGYGYPTDDLTVSGLSLQQQAGLTPPLTPGSYQPGGARPQTIAHALTDSPSGLLGYIYDAIKPSRFGSSSPHSPLAHHSPQSHASPRSQGHSPQPLELSGLQNPWTPTALINWVMIYWLPGPEVALRWMVNSSTLVPTLWASHSSVPLGISHFREPTMPGGASGQTPPGWAEAYHRIAMIRRREGNVRFPAWERPAEIVMDIRELAEIVGHATTDGLAPMVQ